jgi:Glycosyltransferase family 87
VLALCLLALALAATGRTAGTGFAAGAAAALKLFAWPVVLVLAVHAWTRGWRHLGRFAIGAVGVPVVTLAPALLVKPDAVVENVLVFPLGRGLVTSPAQSPLPGHLVATSLPGGRAIAIALILAAGVAIAIWLFRRPPHAAASASLICGYGLLTAVVLLPSTRFGYLLYPASFLVWASALRAVPVTTAVYESIVDEEAAVRGIPSPDR